MNRRPHLELRGASATPEEAAAVMAAVEQFLRDTAPAPRPSGPTITAWQRAALMEGIGLPADAAPWL